MIAHAEQGYREAVERDVPFVFVNEMILQENEKREKNRLRIKQAINNREFRLYFQFIVDARTEEICGGEALSRWQHPEYGLLSPGQYIEMMEDASTISEHDFIVFEKVCQVLERWQKEGWKEFYLSCNFSRLSLSSEAFSERIRSVAEKYRFPRERLMLEITEDSIEKSREVACRNIEACKQYGFQIALDDFGKGSSSVFDLCEYPIDVVKMDKYILNNLESGNRVELIRGIVELAHCLKKKVSCEGIENEAQKRILQQANCDYLQGYYFSRPCPVGEAYRILKEKAKR